MQYKSCPQVIRKIVSFHVIKFWTSIGNKWEVYKTLVLIETWDRVSSSANQGQSM